MRLSAMQRSPVRTVAAGGVRGPASVSRVRLQGVPLLAALCLPLGAAQADSAAFDQCVLELIDNAASDVTVGEIRETCREAEAPVTAAPPAAEPEPPKSAIDRRLALEGATQVVPFVVTPHKPNYIIYTYNFKDYDETLFEQEFNEDVTFRNSELAFQISFKFPVWRTILNTNTHMFVGYTNRSFWQVFDDEDSSPFRETNHEPEAWLSFRARWNLFGLTGRIMQLGLSHQSNGRGGDLSRSWNRVYTNFIFERNNFYFALKPWYRIQEDSDEDDNPDIEDYLGYFEFQSLYKWRDNNFGLLLRNQLKDDYRGAAELDWSFPIKKQLRGYLQYFYGYGDSLIDYNNRVNKLGAGIKLTDWL
jgi:phospholipase A1